MSKEQNSQRRSATPSTAVATPKKEPKHEVRPGRLPMYRVILHNDDVNTVEHVIACITVLTGLNQQDAENRTLEAHRTGCALLLVTHKERAELFVEQFQSASLTVTIEPDE